MKFQHVFLWYDPLVPPLGEVGEYLFREEEERVQSLEIGIKHVGDELRELNYMCVKQSSSGPQFVGLFVTLSVGLPLIQYPTTAKESTPSRPSTAFLTQLLAYCQLSFPTSPPWSSMYRCLSLLDKRVGTSYLFLFYAICVEVLLIRLVTASLAPPSFPLG